MGEPELDNLKAEVEAIKRLIASSGEQDEFLREEDFEVAPANQPGFLADELLDARERDEDIRMEAEEAHNKSVDVETEAGRVISEMDYVENKTEQNQTRVEDLESEVSELRHRVEELDKLLQEELDSRE